MTVLTGEILPYLNAIGTEDGSDAMIAAMKHVGTKFTIDEYTSMGVLERYLIFAKGGVDFLVIDNVLDTIFFRLVATDDGAPYPRPEALIEGLHHGMPRSQVLEILGEPLRNEPNYLFYAVGTKFLNVQVADDRVSDFSLQRIDIAAELEDLQTEPASAAIATTPVTGEISHFIDAVGTEFAGEVMSNLIALVGPRFDSHNIDDEKGTEIFLVFPDGGVDVQYRNGTLSAVLIHTAGDERIPYPRLDALVTGLSLPATRHDVVETLGTPRQSLDALDLYFERGQHVMFNYVNDRLQTISIVHVPAGG